MSREALHIRDLKFTYPGQISRSRGSGTGEALNIGELSIERGRVTVVRGHNGSGKTTLLKVLAGLLQPDSGEIISGPPEKTVLVQQEPYLFHGSVYQNLISPLKFSGTADRNRERLVKEKLSMVGLQGFEKRKARELSGGEKKRVAIARALMTEAPILLLDEPDANVDSRTTGELEQLIRKLRDRGMTIILCSHHKSFAYRCSDTIIDLYKGSPVSHDENIFKGRYIYGDGVYSDFIVGSRSFHCPGRRGEFSTIVIPAENISLSRGGDAMMAEKENRFTGKIINVEAYKEGRFTLSVDCGLMLRVRMSAALITMLKLKKNDEVDLLFSPSSVRLY